MQHRPILGTFLAAALAALPLTPTPGAAQAEGAGSIELVETAPVETTLGSDAIPETVDVWADMFRGAESSIELGFFYASERPDDGKESRLAPLITLLEEAAARGVRVRFLSDIKFYDTYPETLDRLKANGVEVRLYDIRERTGGVLHAKYFVVDGREAYLGSANFDWRALEHIQELGVRIRMPKVARALKVVFEQDWVLGGEGGAAPRPAGSWNVAGAFPAEAVLAGEGGGADLLSVTPVFSPRSILPGSGGWDELWDLPRMIQAIQDAEKEVSVQLLSYSATYWEDGGRRYFGDLEGALRDAAARGVQVRLIVADWGKRKGSVEGLQSLQALPNVEVRFLSLPASEQGFIPFSRVVHAKYMIVDSRLGWLGTSNWSRDYFHGSRNVGLLVEGDSFGRALHGFFQRNWDSNYAETVDPGGEYEPPRVR